jgi:hypothetical protein
VTGICETGQQCCDFGDSDGDTDTDSDGDTDTDTDGDGDGDTDTDGDDAWITITNGGFWQDVDGNRIEAHGAGFLYKDGTWYWIGEDKSHTVNTGGFKRINCYASTNLKDWKFENAVISPSTHRDLQAADRIVERPKFIYNDTTKQYVMWLHWEGSNYADAEAGVFYSDTVCGDYVLHKHFRPGANNMSRDDTLFKDEDGTAYFISATNENWDLAVYELTDDYLDVARQVTTLWVHGHREAPAMFKDEEDRFFLITSGCTGWDPNQGQYAYSTAVGDGWSDLINFGDSITYDTQPTYVIPVIGTKTTTYVYAGDRWQDPELVDSKYIWLPIKKSGTDLSLDYYDEWQLNVKTGEWRVFDGYIPQGEWSLVYVDSQETVDENGRAENAFDDSASTYWHTEWQSDGPHDPMPHEIQIDLGSEWDISGFRYLPRQDKDTNGTIHQYEFYISLSSDDWGRPVAEGRFDTDRAAKTIEFGTTRGRYIRLVVLSEIGGGDWACVAELDLFGEAAE